MNVSTDNLTPGQLVTITTVPGKTVLNAETVTGVFVSVNSKGVNVKVNGKVRSFSIKRIESITTDATDGYSTADVAAMLGMTPKELRVHLRALAMGVGKGHKYGLTDADVKVIRAALADA